MPITGKFIADFTAFQTAVQQAEVSLKGMETGASKVQTSLNRMVDSLGGRKLVQEATLAAEAVERIGGVSKLTEAELQKLGGQALEASNKLKAMGQEVPPGIQKIVDAANKVKPALDSATSSASGLMSTVQKAAGIFGIAFSVQALTGFIGKVFDTASAIKDLSESLGLSTDEVQKFKFAAEQGGGSLDDVGNSIRFMQQKLVDGSKETATALDALGLKLNEVRQQSPGEALLTVTDALKDMENPAQRTTTQIDLLGKASKGLGPTIASGFREASEAANIMSKDTIKDLEAAQQAWENLGNTVIVITGNIIANTARAVKEATGSWQKFLIFAANATTMGIGPAAALASATAEAASAANDLAENAAKVPPVLGKTKAEMDAAAEATKKLKQEWEAYIAGALKRGDAQIQYNKQLEVGLKNVNDEMRKFVSVHLKELGDRGLNILKLTTDETVHLGLAWMKMGPVIEGIGNDFIKALDPKTFKVRDLPPEFKKVTDSVGDLSTALLQMGSVVGGTFATVITGLGNIVGAAKNAKIAIQEIKDAAKTTDKFEGILGMTSGILGIITVAIQAYNAIRKIWTALENREGRHAIEDFAESWGGFDALHAKLLEIGAAGEELWIKLTQGVPAGNPEYAARVIAEAEAALAAQAAAVDDVTTATEEQAQATIETASQATKALEELGPRLAENESQWRHWGDIVTAQIQKIADGVRAMPLPSAMAIAGGGNGGIHGGMGPIMNGDVVVRSNLYIDGYVAAESVSRQVVG